MMTTWANFEMLAEVQKSYGLNMYTLIENIDHFSNGLQTLC